MISNLSRWLAAASGIGALLIPTLDIAVEKTTDQRQVISIEAYGDSTLVGVVPGTDKPSHTSPLRVSRIALGMTFPHQRIILVSHARGGTSLADLMSGEDGRHAPWPQTIKASSASIIILNHGVNDARQDQPTATYRANLLTFVQEAKRYGKTVIFDTPTNSVAGGTLTAAFPKQRIEAMRQAMKDVAQAEHVTLCDEDLAIRQSGLYTLQYFPDGIHSSDDLYQLKGQTLSECLAPVIKSLIRS